MKHETLPYWLVNVPREQWPTECPEFLVNANTKDQGILSTPDSEYSRQTWEEVQQIISTDITINRAPSDLRRYLAYTFKLKKEYGSVINFVQKERLQWTDLTPSSSVPFSEPADIKILYNDWPYGIDPKIVHLVIWTKFDLDDDPATDELTPKARKEIDDYVNETFCTKVPNKNIIWFKNWRSLKSIQAIEHFHVMLYDPDPGFVQQITNGDIPLSAKVV
ncbi:hypothetical protein MMC18_004699 [Xylographa bjoerkii]|nr:hypothetical protein [Xylographa bjoerkii]